MLRRNTAFLALVCGISLAADAPDRTLQDQLNDQYSNKVLFLRHAFASASQEYDSAGKARGHLQEGPWTFYERLLIKKIVLQEDKLELEGTRVVYRFDKDGESLISIPIDESVKVAIKLSNPLASVDQAVSLLGRVFAMTEKEVLNATPVHWRPYLAKQQSDTDGKSDVPRASGTASTGSDAGDGRTARAYKAPKVQFAPAPEFQAQNDFQGVVVLRVIIESNGRIGKVKVVRPLGKGLDEEAIRAVKAWKFTPAMYEGKPVAVPVDIEVDFHLYDNR